MHKWIVNLTVQVTVEANSPQQAEQIAFKNAETLRRSDKAWVSSAVYVREDRG
jgi:hypothetical protein